MYTSEICEIDAMLIKATLSTRQPNVIISISLAVNWIVVVVVVFGWCCCGCCCSSFLLLLLPSCWWWFGGVLYIVFLTCVSIATGWSCSCTIMDTKSSISFAVTTANSSSVVLPLSVLLLPRPLPPVLVVPPSPTS